MLQIPVPQHRMTPLKTTWMDLYKTVTEVLKLDMRMNLKTRKACSTFLHEWPQFQLSSSPKSINAVKIMPARYVT